MSLISIITPAFNAANTIGDAIKSVQAQNYADWEMIIIDDCSDDGTGAIVERFAAEDRRIRLIRRSEHSGIVSSRNKGLVAANGRYIAFIDADDVWRPEKLAQQIAFMQSNKAGISYHAYRCISPQGKIGRIIRGPVRVTFETLLKKSSPTLFTMMIDRHMIGELTFDENLRGELALWLQLTKSGHDILFMDADLAIHRVPSQKSSSLIRTIFATFQTYRHAAGLTMAQSFRALTFSGFFAALKRIG